MSNFYELEKRYKKYRNKFYLKIFIIFSISILILLFSYILLLSKTETKKPQLQDLNKSKIEVIKKEKNVTTKITEKVVEIKKVVDLNKSKEIKKIKEKKEEENNVSKQKLEKLPVSRIPILKPKLNIELFEYKDITNEKTPAKVEKKREVKKVVEKKRIEKKRIEKEMAIITTTELPSFEKEFKLLEKYYNNGNYQKSMELALRCEKIRHFNEDVWRIYALSLYKLNKKEKAIKVLETYLKAKESIKIRNTLNIINKEKN